MKHENDFSNMVGCLQVVRIYSFVKEIKVPVKTENIFMKEIKHGLRAFIVWWKPSTASLEKLSQLFASVFTSYQGTENIFYFLKENWMLKLTYFGLNLLV